MYKNMQLLEMKKMLANLHMFNSITVKQSRV